MGYNNVFKDILQPIKTSYHCVGDSKVPMQIERIWDGTPLEGIDHVIFSVQTREQISVALRLFAWCWIFPQGKRGEREGAALGRFVPLFIFTTKIYHHWLRSFWNCQKARYHYKLRIIFRLLLTRWHRRADSLFQLGSIWTHWLISSRSINSKI